MRLAFALSGTILFVLLCVAGFRDTHPRWRDIQRNYKEIASQRATDPRVAEAIQTDAVAIKQLILSDLGRVDRCTTCHIGVDNPAMGGAPAPLEKHPGELLVDHPPERFGCTICHGGQGLATSEEGAHARDYNGWEYPLLQTGLVGSTCIRCHQGTLPEGAGAVIRGKRIFLESGCKGCHQIDGRGGILGPPLTGLGEVPIRKKHASEAGLEKYIELARGDYNYAYILESINEPKADNTNSAMPRFEFSTTDLLALGAYVKGQSVRKMPEEYVVMGEKSPSTGTALYGEFCSACHGRNGEGGLQVGRMGPSLNNQDFLAVVSPLFVRAVIANGRTGFNKVMPAWRTVGGLQEEEVSLLTDYVLGFKNPPPSFEAVQFAEGSAEAGAALFADKCSACHGKKLEGGIGPNLSNSTFLRLADKHFLYHVLAFGRRGSGMPSWQTLTPEEFKSVILFLESQVSASTSVSEVVATVGDAKAGARRYRRRCQACHGPEGAGRIAPPLNGEAFLAAASGEYLARVIVDGRPIAGMPSWKSLSAEEIANIIAYLQSFGSGQPFRVDVGKGDVLTGEHLYGEACASCHGAGGLGAVGPAIGSTAFLSQVSDEFVKAIIAYPQGHGHLPGVAQVREDSGRRLSDSELDDVVRYVRSLAARTAGAPRIQRGSAAAGKEPYERVCAECHGKKGRGGTGPALANPDFLDAVGDRFIVSTAVMGRPGTAMFAVVSDVAGDKSVTPNEIVDVVAYLREASRQYWQEDGPRVRRFKGDAKDGAKVFHGICEECHGVAGRGSDKAPALNDPVFLDNATDGYLAATIVLGRRGTLMHRRSGPGAKLGELDSPDILNVVEYLRSLQSGTPPSATEASASVVR